MLIYVRRLTGRHWSHGALPLVQLIAGPWDTRDYRAEAADAEVNDLTRRLNEYHGVFTISGSKWVIQRCYLLSLQTNRQIHFH